MLLVTNYWFYSWTKKLYQTSFSAQGTSECKTVPSRHVNMVCGLVRVGNKLYMNRAANLICIQWVYSVGGISLFTHDKHSPYIYIFKYKCIRAYIYSFTRPTGMKLSHENRLAFLFSYKCLEYRMSAYHIMYIILIVCKSHSKH